MLAVRRVNLSYRVHSRKSDCGYRYFIAWPNIFWNSAIFSKNDRSIVAEIRSVASETLLRILNGLRFQTGKRRSHAQIVPRVLSTANGSHDRYSSQDRQDWSITKFRCAIVIFERDLWLFQSLLSGIRSKSDPLDRLFLSSLVDRSIPDSHSGSNHHYLPHLIKPTSSTINVNHSKSVNHVIPNSDNSDRENGLWISITWPPVVNLIRPDSSSGISPQQE
jgi:hypothetical protein